ncbi:MAG TPA: alpha/beta hydrolase [Bradyrhizobium sp.]
MHRLFHVLFGAGIAVVLALGGARASTALYPDSKLVTRDRFSDEIVGTGPDLVFIPGLVSSRATWKATADRLKDHYRLHLIQIAGFAGEPSRANAKGDVLVPTAKAINAYLVAAHLTPATIIGHSLGGTIALYLAEHHGDHLKKIMLVDALPFYATLIGGPDVTVDKIKPIADKIRSKPFNLAGPEQEARIRQMVTGDTNVAMVASWSQASDGAVGANAMADDMTLDLRPGLATIATPITLLYPDYAAVGVPKGGSTAMYSTAYASAPHVTLVQATNSLHFIMLDQPAQFDEALDAFLKE